MKSLLRSAFLTIAIILSGARNRAAETTSATVSWPPAEPAAIEHWRSLRFGMFIHWGPVSLTGHEIGWSRGQELKLPAIPALESRAPATAGK